MAEITNGCFRERERERVGRPLYFCIFVFFYFFALFVRVEWIEGVVGVTGSEGGTARWCHGGGLNHCSLMNMALIRLVNQPASRQHHVSGPQKKTTITITTSTTNSFIYSAYPAKKQAIRSTSQCNTLAAAVTLCLVMWNHSFEPYPPSRKKFGIQFFLM